MHTFSSFAQFNFNPSHGGGEGQWLHHHGGGGEPPITNTGQFNVLLPAEQENNWKSEREKDVIGGPLSASSVVVFLSNADVNSQNHIPKVCFISRCSPDARNRACPYPVANQEHREERDGLLPRGKQIANGHPSPDPHAKRNKIPLSWDTPLPLGQPFSSSFGSRQTDKGLKLSRHIVRWGGKTHQGRRWRVSHPATAGLRNNPPPNSCGHTWERSLL